MEVLNFIISSKNRVKILPCGRLSSGLDSSVNTFGLVSKFKGKNSRNVFFSTSVLCTSWKGHFFLSCKLNVKWSIQVRNQYLNYTVRHVTNTSFYDKVMSEIITDSKTQGTRYSSKTNQQTLTLSVPENWKTPFLKCQ